MVGVENVCRRHSRRSRVPPNTQAWRHVCTQSIGAHRTAGGTANSTSIPPPPHSSPHTPHTSPLTHLPSVDGRRVGGSPHPQQHLSDTVHSRYGTTKHTHTRHAPEVWCPGDCGRQAAGLAASKVVFFQDCIGAQHAAAPLADQGCVGLLLCAVLPLLGLACRKEGRGREGGRRGVRGVRCETGGREGRSGMWKLGSKGARAGWCHARLCNASSG